MTTLDELAGELGVATAALRDLAAHDGTVLPDAGPLPASVEERLRALALASPGDLFLMNGDLPPHLELVRRLRYDPSGDESVVVDQRDGRRKLLRRWIGVGPSQADVALWRMLDPAHVVRILDADREHDPVEWVLLDVAEGGTLADLADRERVLDDTDVLDVVDEVSAALAHWHARGGVAHGDVRPGTLLTRQRDPLDLVLDLPVPPADETPLYRSPEQLAGETSPAADWWALGVIVAELLTGKHPFVGDDRSMVPSRVEALITQHRLRIGEITDPRWRLLVHGLLTENPTRRWAVAEVDDWLAGESPALDEAIDDSGAFVWRGHRCDGPTELAAALAAEWAAAVALAAGPSDERSDLMTWCRARRLSAAVAVLDADQVEPALRAAHLVAALDPEAPPVARAAQGQAWLRRTVAAQPGLLGVPGEAGDGVDLVALDDEILLTQLDDGVRRRMRREANEVAGRRSLRSRPGWITAADLRPAAEPERSAWAVLLRAAATRAGRPPSSPTARWTKRVVAIVAAAVLVGAGLFVWRTLADDEAASTPAPTTAPSTTVARTTTTAAPDPIFSSASAQDLGAARLRFRDAAALGFACFLMDAAARPASAPYTLDLTGLRLGHPTGAPTGFTATGGGTGRAPRAGNTVTLTAKAQTFEVCFPEPPLPENGDRSYALLALDPAGKLVLWQIPAP